MIRNYVIVCDFILACYWLYTLKLSPMCQILCHEIFMSVVGIVNARSVKITATPMCISCNSEKIA